MFVSLKDSSFSTVPLSVFGLPRGRTEEGTVVGEYLGVRERDPTPVTLSVTTIRQDPGSKKESGKNRGKSGTENHPFHSRFLYTDEVSSQGTGTRKGSLIRTLRDGTETG